MHLICFVNRRSVSECFLIPIILKCLFLPEENVDRCTSEIPVLSYPVFNEPFIRFFNPLGKIAKEGKRGYLRIRQLRDILNFNVFPLICRWGRSLNQRQ